MFAGLAELCIHKATPSATVSPVRQQAQALCRLSGGVCSGCAAWAKPYLARTSSPGGTKIMGGHGCPQPTPHRAPNEGPSSELTSSGSWSVGQDTMRRLSHITSKLEWLR